MIGFLPGGALALVASVLLPVTVFAQRVSVTPLIGVYAPTEYLYVSRPDLSGETETYKLDSGVAYGGALGVWISSRLGFALSGTVVPTSLRHDHSGGPELTAATLTQGSMQAVFLLASVTAIVVPYINGGFGLVSRGGEAFSASAETRSTAGILGAGTAVRMGSLSLSVGAEVIDYTATYDLTGGPARQFAQRDYQLRVGLGTVFGRR